MRLQVLPAQVTMIFKRPLVKSTGGILSGQMAVDIGRWQLT